MIQWLLAAGRSPADPSALDGAVLLLETSEELIPERQAHRAKQRDTAIEVAHKSVQTAGCVVEAGVRTVEHQTHDTGRPRAVLGDDHFGRTLVW